jgi:hypothetical protein
MKNWNVRHRLDVVDAEEVSTAPGRPLKKTGYTETSALRRSTLRGGSGPDGAILRDG